MFEKKDCKFNRADCNERNICVCPKDPFPYLDVREHECISRDQYLARYPGLTTPKGWRPGLDQVDCDDITTSSSQSAEESIVKIVQNPRTTMPCKNVIGPLCQSKLLPRVLLQRRQCIPKMLLDRGAELYHYTTSWWISTLKRATGHVFFLVKIRKSHL